MTMTPDEIRGIRAIHGFSQAKLADELGLSVRTVQQWEQGIRGPGMALVPRLRALQATEDQRRAAVLDAIEVAAQRAEEHKMPALARDLRELSLGF